jgi:hypothetical protein
MKKQWQVGIRIYRRIIDCPFFHQFLGPLAHDITDMDHWALSDKVEVICNKAGLQCYFFDAISSLYLDITWLHRPTEFSQHGVVI